MYELSLLLIQARYGMCFPVEITRRWISNHRYCLVSDFSLYLTLTRTYFGKSVRATAQDRDAGNLMGINVERTYLIFFALSAALAGIAGVVAAVNYSVYPTVGFEWLLKAIIILVLAGFGKIGQVFAAGCC